MNSLSPASVALDSIATDQPGDYKATSKDISRAVFDDLLERDLLGFLFSSIHLRKYLANFSIYADPEMAQAIKRNLCSVEIIDQFHKETLAMFAGAHIPESKCANQRDLMAALDAKYEEYARDLDSANVHCKISPKQLPSIELAWRYRNACESGNPLAAL